MKKSLAILFLTLFAVFAFAQITPPYTEAFDGVTAPALPASWTIINSNGDAQLWKTAATNYNSAPNCLYILYNGSLAMNDWAITPALNLTTGINYTLQFKYKAGSYTELLAVHLGTAATVAGMAVTPLTDLSFSSTTYATATVTVTVPTSGTYYLGFHGHSAADQYYMCIDDITLMPPMAPYEVSGWNPADLLTGVDLNKILSWVSGGGGAPSGTRLYLGTDNPPTNILGVSGTEIGLVTSYTKPTLYLPSTDYFWKVVPWNAVGDAPSTVKKFTTGTTWAYGASTATSTADDDIGQVIIGTTANPTTAPDSILSNSTQNKMYTDYTSLTPIDIQQVAITPISILQTEFGTTLYSCYTKVFIDYNQNGQFDLPGELAFGAATGGTNPNPRTGTFSVPITATLGNTRMRVVLVEGGTSTSVVPVGTYSWGETEDYTVNILEPPAAPVFYYEPTSINFGGATIPVPSASVDVTVTNAGGGNIHIAASDVSIIGTDAGQFSFSAVNLPATLGSPVIIPVTFTPTSPGAKTATLRIVNNETRTNYDVTLEGNGVTGVVTMNNGTTALAVGAVYGFYDTGGPLANYSASENLVHTFTPPPGYLIQSDFDSYASEADYDTLFVYNGSSTSSPLLGTFSGAVTVPQFISTAGALTFKFMSDSGVQDFGWSAVISAIPGATGAPEAVRLDYPANLATGLPKAGFSLAWTPMGGGLPDNYGIYLSTDPDDIYGQEYWETTNTSFNPVTEGSYALNYEGVYYWTIEAFKTGYTSAVQDTFFRFTVEPDPAIDTFPWSEGFEGTTFPPAGWAMFDADADANVWFTYSVAATAHTGTKSAASASWLSGSGALTPDNWLISPPINVPAARVEYMIEWYMGAQDPAFPAEHYGVYVSTASTDTTDFTELFVETLPDGLWHYRSQSLAAYAGQTIYIAFRHFDCTDQFYMKLDDVQIREIPQVPIFDISPTVWNIADTQLLNPVTKTFTIANAGIDDITINEGDIYLSGDTEGNFTLTATGLPVVLGETGVESYSFTVRFLPLTVGAKTATLNVEDNLTARVLHNIALSGTCVEEPTASIIQLTGAVAGTNNVNLAWRKIYGDPGSPSWVHWDSGLNGNSIGAGTSPMDVAVKYDSLEIAGYAGMELTKVKFFLQAFPPATTLNVKVWSGLNGTLAPVTVLVNQAVPAFVAGWNEVLLASAVPITGLEAIYIGYTVVPGAAGFYPAGVDGLAAVANRGNLISVNSGAWTTLASSSIAGNWNIHGYMDVPPSPMARRQVRLLHTPVAQREMTKAEMHNYTVSASNPNPSRLLRGFNIFRDTAQINTTLVTTYAYSDLDLAAGTYEYTVQAVHYSANGPMSDPVSVLVTYIPPIALPFTEDWADTTFVTNNWTPSETNWEVSDTYGNPSPEARFNWSPAATDYSLALTSFNFDATGMSNVKLSFDLALSNYDTDAENSLSVEVWDGTVWQNVVTYSSFDNAGAGWDFGFNNDSYDISAFAANRIFKVRFVAFGENTFSINYWYLDNISLKEMPSTLEAPTCTITLNGADIDLACTAVAGADWYGIYYSAAYEGPYTLVNWIPNGVTSVTYPTDLLGFYKVTAGAGALPPARLEVPRSRRR